MNSNFHLNFKEAKIHPKENKKTIENSSHYARLSSADKSRQNMYQTLKKFPNFSSYEKYSKLPIVFVGNIQIYK